MPRSTRAPRAAIVALILSVLTLADGLSVPAERVAMAAEAQPTTAGTVSQEADACAQGFTEVDHRLDMSLHGVTIVPRGTIAVGYTRTRLPGQNGIRVPATLVNRGSGWLRVPTKGAGDEDGLMAVASREGADTWAVGFATFEGEVKPLAMRWDGSTWHLDRPSVSGPVALFTAVTIVGDGSPFAVGYRMAEDGKRKPLVMRKDGPRWRSTSMAVRPGESVTLTSVAPDRKGGTWVVGHGGAGAEIKPLIYNRDKGRWKRYPLPRIAGEGVLTDIIATHGHESWAVGYQLRDGSARALVLRWNGRKWRRAVAPHLDSNEVMLNAVSRDPAGGIWVVGAAWDEPRKDFKSFAARWDGRAWSETAGAAGGTELHDAIGSLTGNGWAVGRSNGSASVVRVCDAPAVDGGSSPGSSEPRGDATPTDPDAGDDGVEPESPDADDLESYVDDDEGEGRPAPSLRKNGKKPGKAKVKIGNLPKATAHRRIVARDVARPAGVFEDTGTYGAVVADFDGDGVDDLFIGRHGRKGRLLLDRNGRFVDHEPLVMAPIDRHGCTAADVDGSGLPDLYCTVGGKRGSGLKSNELWLDPGGPAPVEVASARGLSDLAGRGRLAAFLEARRQQAVDLLVFNTPTRVDGLPSLARQFRANGKGGFKARPQASVTPRRGARAVVAADFDRDGRRDLLLVTGGPQSPEPGASRLYRNTSRGLVDVTRKMGIRSFDEMDAELIDLDRDGKLDLVQLSQVKLKISLQKKGRFRKVYERKLTNGQAIAGGDVNHDRRGDLYIVRSGPDGNRPDVMLLNRRNGRRWSSMLIPQVTSGAGEDAYAIDHDGNGLDDFLVLNGHNVRGPTQLIAFYRR